ncbi:hypothetical protein OUZ56_012436 [Daphnia magna]|uniref:Uncharacterized protein n=1 Tax=Daphnia magna TaxID=35525 RepID=A0ABQ9Z308_9CRUS|nr:hypothetical protein OUZ56_012436 [Daphnia magna]
MEDDVPESGNADNAENNHADSDNDCDSVDDNADGISLPTEHGETTTAEADVCDQNNTIFYFAFNVGADGVVTLSNEAQAQLIQMQEPLGVLLQEGELNPQFALGMLDDWQQTVKGKDIDAIPVSVSDVALGDPIAIPSLMPEKRKKKSGGAIESKKSTSFLSTVEQTVGRPIQTSVCVAHAPKSNQPPQRPTQIPIEVAETSANVSQTSTYFAQTRASVVKTTANISQTTSNAHVHTSIAHVTSCVEPVPKTVDQDPPGSLTQIPKSVAQTPPNVYQDLHLMRSPVVLVQRLSAAYLSETFNKPVGKSAQTPASVSNEREISKSKRGEKKKAVDEDNQVATPAKSVKQKQQYASQPCKKPLGRPICVGFPAVDENEIFVCPDCRSDIQKEF